jgi:NitT/TauT family transport system ATP-binding protein
MVAAVALKPAAPSVAAGQRIDVEHVSHSFEFKGAPLPVLDNIDFSVEPGSFVALLGPSGCGKSTLLRLLAGLDHPTAGTVRVGGVEVGDPDPSRILVFQDPTLFPWRTVWDNVALGLEAQGILRRSRHRVDNAVRLVGLNGFEKAYPHQLSGGMAQRVALARALVNEPRLLLLDEPLGKLDSLTRLIMQTEIVKLWQEAGLTAVLVTHDVEEALFLTERVLVFGPRPARIVADIAVDLPYPRHRGDPRLAELRREALGHLGLAATW